ncbi:MAG: oxygenase MpaB family protein [Acidimicrobiia bacterium]
MHILRGLVDGARARVVAATNGLFAHGPYPLAETLSFPGDPGLFGPDSATWRVIGDSAVFIGGIRALLVQAAHPEVAAGVADHSRYRHDPLGRLSHTAAYVTATAFGAMPEVDRAIATVRRRHEPVVGRSHRGLAYDADAPDLAAWVHNSLAQSFLVAYQVYGSRPCPSDDADRYVREQARLGALHHAAPLPDSADALADWIAGHPRLAPSPGQREAIEFLRRPPLSWPVRIAYGFLFRAAVATLPPRIRTIIGVRAWPGAVVMGRVVTTMLRLSLGSSLSWRVALLRVGAPEPSGVTFRQPLPPAAEAYRAARAAGTSAPSPTP